MRLLVERSLERRSLIEVVREEIIITITLSYFVNIH